VIRLHHLSYLVLLAATCTFSSVAQQLTLPNQPDSVHFAVIGDNGTGQRPEYEVAERLAALHAKFHFDFIIMMGDNLYGGESPKDFVKKFERPYKTLLDAGVKFYACLGNHDDPENQRKYESFNMRGDRYDTFKMKDVRFFSLDSNYMDPKQLAWLEKQLQDAGNSDWKICYFHHPLYSSGKTHGSSVELRALLEPMFIKYGVDAVFSGHDHVYERVQPQKGIYYFTEGSSGQLRNGDLAKTNMTQKGFDTDRTFMLVEVAGDELYFQTLTRAGATVDSGVLKRTREPAEVPPAAANVPTSLWGQLLHVASSSIQIISTIVKYAIKAG
jgi:predicted phosphodiesterase